MLAHAYDSIITIENLLLTWERFVRGTKRRKDVRQFQTELARNIASLYRELKNRTYAHGPDSAFSINDPKQRNIHKATVRDRVVHHLLYKALYWYFHSRFIYDSYSCRVAKGTHRALDRFRSFARKVSKNDTRTCFVLNGDIRKFFANMDHNILMCILERHILDPDIRWLIGQVLVSFHSGIPGKGLPLGNLTAQLLVNMYMHEFDMFMKQELRVTYYIRYADDFVILSERRTDLKKVLPKLRQFLHEELRLTLHERKVSTRTHASGVDFLGWLHFPHHRQIRTATKRKVVGMLRGHPKPEAINAYRGLLRHGDTYRLRARLGIVS